MSIEETARIWETSQQEGTALLVLLAIADSANKHGHAWPGREHLALYARCDEATVSRLCHKIEAEGELYIVRRKGRSNHYMVLAGLTDPQKQARRQFLDDLLSRHEKSSDKKSLLRRRGSDHRITTGSDTAITTGRSPAVRGSAVDPSIEPSVDPSNPMGPHYRQIWQDCLRELQLQLPKEAFQSWLLGSQLVRYKAGCYTIVVRDFYARDWLEQRLKNTVLRTLSHVAREEVTVRFIVPEQFVQEGDSETHDSPL